MNFYEKVFVKKISKQKYEIITKDFELKDGVYTLYKLKKDYFLKPDNYEYKNKQEYFKKEEPSKTILKDYYIFSNENEAKTFSRKYFKEIKSKKLIGLKGFDGNFYILKTEFFDKIKNLILKLNKQEFIIKDLEKLITINPNALRGILEIMKEEGIIIENKKDSFKLL